MISKVAAVKLFESVNQLELFQFTVCNHEQIPDKDSAGHIEKTIFLIRGERVMLDRDLATLYGVTTSALKQAVRRNMERFPQDFMFVLSQSEFDDWRSQIVISSPDRKGLRCAPMAFTEQGVAMLSSVLRSKRAIVVNVQIMRTFVRLRQMLASNTELARKLNRLEQRYDHQFRLFSMPFANL